MPDFKIITPKIIGVVVGGVILALAVPRLMAEMTMLSVQPTLTQLNAGKAVSDEKMIEAYEAMLASENWVQTGDRLLKRAWLENQFAQRSDDQETEIKWLEVSERTTEQSLLKAPGNPYAWIRLAYLRFKLSGADSGAKEALLMSLRTGPYERTLALKQVHYAINMWQSLSTSEQEEVMQTIVWTDTFARKKLINLAQDNKKARNIIIAALSKEPEQLKVFVRELLRRK